MYTIHKRIVVIKEDRLFIEFLNYIEELRVLESLQITH